MAIATWAHLTEISVPRIFFTLFVNVVYVKVEP